MTFWASQPEPHRQYRWYINFVNPTLQGMRYLLKKASRPNLKITEVTHKYVNHFYYYPGRMEWDPIQVSFAGGKVAQGTNAGYKTADDLLVATLAASGYLFPGDASTATNLATITKSKNVTALVGSGATTAAVKLVNLNGDGTDGNEYYLWNPMFMDIKFDTLEYASEEILNLDCTIRYDYATMGAAGTTFQI